MNSLYKDYGQKARKEVFGIEDEVCVLDVETTGISPVYEGIIEIAIAKMRGPEIIDEFNTYVNPGKPISREITELTNISDNDVADAPAIADILDDIADFVGDCDIVAHNAAFDRSFVEAAFYAADRSVLPGRWLDSLVFLRCGLPLLRSFKLEDMMRDFCPDEYKRAHRAIADVRGLCHLWRVALVGISSLDKAVLRSLPGLLEGLPERDWVARVAQLYGADDSGSSGKGSMLRLKALRQQNIKGSMPDELLDARVKDGIHSISAKTIEDDLSAAGLAGSMYESFEARPEQGQMAEAIRQSFESKTHLVVEAGTGVGKSLAYLVCLARLAQKNNITVGVATKTNALTDQLMGKELPLLAASLADHPACSGVSTQSEDAESLANLTPPLSELRYAALKGYSHYPCLRKISSSLNSADEGSSARSSQFAVALAQLVAWISQTDWGELSSINLALPYVEKQNLAASSTDCLRRRCSYYFQCYVHGARRIAKGAHIVVTNHSLLLRNSGAEGKILPPIRYWAIDEAHNLESEARKQLTRSFDEREFDATLKLVSGSRGLPKRLLTSAGKYMSKGDVDKTAALVDTFQEHINQLQILYSNFFAFVHDLGEHESLQSENSHYANSKASKTHWIGPELRDSSAWGGLCGVGTSLAAQMQATIDAGKEFTSHYGSRFMEDTPPIELSDFVGVMTMLAGLLDTLTMAINEAEENHVYALCFSREYQGKRTAAIEISQLEVGEQVVDHFLEHIDSAIFTSATLAVGDSFKRFTSGVGLDTLPSCDNEAEGKWRSLQLASSYDLPNLMRIFVPADLPDPRDHQWSEQLIEFLRQVHIHTDGGVLTLFTSRRDVLAARDTLQDELRPLGIDVLAQDGMLSMRVLQERFIDGRQTSLLATKSFWEGFDASGDTLRCIVIPKLPFGRPDTPLARERSLVYGRSAWARYDLPETILELKQAVGRLVRTSTDSGIVILADTRVLTKGYGKRVLNSLPVPAEALSMRDIFEQDV